MDMNTTIVIRRATDSDAPALDTLAQLDSARTLSGDVLIAEVDGAARAAIRVADGTVTADPFVPTQDVVAMLELRAAALRGEPRSRSHGRLFARPALARS